MLTALTIRDVVLISRLDLTFDAGLTVLTGETGAGKSILLDSLGLALGMRAESGLVRADAEHAMVTASFAPPDGHPVHALLAEHDLAVEDELVLRRVVMKDGRSRAFANDQPVSVTLLRRIGTLLVEVQGQHEQMGLADPAGHAGLLDIFGVKRDLQERVSRAWRAWRATVARLTEARKTLEAAQRDEEWLRHAVHELTSLAPQPNEEALLAAERQRLQQGERRVEAVAAALAELSSKDRRNPGPAAALRASSRALQRLVPTGQPDLPNPAGSALAALERAEEALAEAESLLSRLASETDADPKLLEQAEERLFSLRGAARKHNVTVAELPGLLVTLAMRLGALDSGATELAELERAASEARLRYLEAAQALTQAREAAAGRLERAVASELPPLKLDRARFHVDISAVPETGWGSSGMDAVRFLIATNPGQTPGPLARIASGGELSRLMLALKVVLSSGSSVPTLVFDEVDSGIGGATAAAVGERLARVAERVQVLVVTHSPQVAARGSAHLRVSKLAKTGSTATSVDPLDGGARREEIARMLAGARITPAARAAADELLARPQDPVLI